jgi:hypothetical protein
VIKAGIQRALDLYAQAYNERNADLLKQAVDQDNAPFRRFMQTRFERASAASGANRRYTVQAILKQLPYSFVLARIESADGGLADVTFRETSGRWLMSEPTETQLGPQQQIEHEHFTFITYPWIEDITPTIETSMERARETVLQRLGKTSDQKPRVLIKPIFGLGSPVAADLQAYYIRDNRSQARIEVFAPGSYPFGFYDPAAGWERHLEQLLTHEYTHLVNDLSFIPLSRMSGWMSEGLAEYVADIRHTDTVRDIVQSGRIIPIVDPNSSTVYKQDLEHIDTLDASPDESYGLAYTLVAYIVERHGGLEGFWKLARAYDKTQRLDPALQQAFGITYNQFDQGWRDWLEENY